MVFFSKNRKTALQRVGNLSKTDKSYKGKSVRLAETQIKHSSGWKTWKLTKR